MHAATPVKGKSRIEDCSELGGKRCHMQIQLFCSVVR